MSHPLPKAIWVWVVTHWVQLLVRVHPLLAAISSDLQALVVAVLRLVDLLVVTSSAVVVSPVLAKEVVPAQGVALVEPLLDPLGIEDKVVVVLVVFLVGLGL